MNAASITADLQADYFGKFDVDEIDLAAKLQSVDLLDDLGYIKSGGSDPNALAANEIAAALSQFRAEVRQTPLKAKPQTSTQSFLSQDEADFFGLLTSLDESVRLKNYSLRQIAADNLLTRILNYRLSILSLAKSRISNELTSEAEQALELIRSLSASENLNQAIALTDDFQTLSSRLVEQPEFSESDFCGIVYFQSKRDTKERRFINKKTEFVKQAKLLQGHDASEQISTIRRASGRKSGRTIEGLNSMQFSRISHLSANPINLLFISLMQIRLYVAGVYTGKIDNSMGAFTIDAIKDYLEMENFDEHEDQLDQGRFIIKIHSRVWAINAVFFIKSMLLEPGSAEQTDSISGEIKRLSDQLPDEDKPKLYESLDDIMQKQLGSESRKSTRAKKSRSFLSKIKSVFGKIKNAVANGIRAVLKVLKKLFGWIKTGIRLLVLEIGAAIRKVKLAVKFIFSDRIVRTGAIRTDFDQDFDVATIISDEETEANMIAHRARLLDISGAVVDIASFLSKAIPIIINLLKPPFGWLAAGISLVRILADSGFLKTRIPQLPLLG